MAGAPAPCLLCEQPAEIARDFDTHACLVNCDACGHYAVTEDAQEVLDTPKYKSDRFKNFWANPACYGRASA